MIFNNDIIQEIIEFDPQCSHNLISKQWKYVCDKLYNYIRIWNLDFDNSLESLNYIKNKILPLNKWGNKEDQLWYQQKLNFEKNEDSELFAALDLENLLAQCQPQSFHQIYPLTNNINLFLLYYLIGKHNNLDLIKDISTRSFNIVESLIFGAINGGNVQMLEFCHTYFGKRPDITLMTSSTIESYSDQELRYYIDQMEMANTVLPIKIQPSHNNMKSTIYLKGLVKLNRDIDDIDLTWVNHSIYILGNDAFNIWHKDSIQMIINHKLYNHLFLIAIIKSCISLEFIDILDQIKNSEDTFFPSNMIDFCLTHQVYIRYLSLKWIEKYHEITQEQYKKIYNSSYRELKVAIYCLSKIVKMSND